MATKPPTKPAAAAKEETPVAAPPPKSKKMLIIVIVLLLVIIAGGAAWFFMKGNKAHAEKETAAAPKAEAAQETKFVPLGENFTVNLQREEGDQYLQAGITLKILHPELEDKIKALMPEIRSKLLFLLSSKKPSELQTTAGKQHLVTQIIATVDSVLGVSPATTEPAAPSAAPEAASGAASAAVAAAPAPAAQPNPDGVVDVLFTSFIIQ